MEVLGILQPSCDEGRDFHMMIVKIIFMVILERSEINLSQLEVVILIEA